MHEDWQSHVGPLPSRACSAASLRFAPFRGDCASPTWRNSRHELLLIGPARKAGSAQQRSWSAKGLARAQRSSLAEGDRAVAWA